MKTPETILNDFATWTNDIDIKGQVNKMLMGCLASDQELTPGERRQMIEAAELLNMIFSDLEAYRIENNLTLPSELNKGQLN